MRISMVMASAEDGGLEKHVIELSNALAQTHQVSLIAHPRYQSAVQPQVNFIALDLSGSRYNPWTKYQLKQKILASTPDVVHAHASKTAKLMQSMVKSLPCPSVVTVHGLKKNNAAYFAFHHIIAVSDRVAQALGKTNQISVVYNGVQMDASPTAFEKNRRFIAIGRLNEVKGFDVLLQAWQQLPYHLSIVGEGELYQTLQQQIEQLQLADRVQLCGYREDIADLISAHEALIVSSLREGGPYTMAESLLLSRPVLGTDVGMMAEFLPAEVLCQPNNIAALAQVITHYSTFEQPQQVYQVAYDKAQTQLSFSQMLEHTVAVYQQIQQKIS